MLKSGLEFFIENMKTEDFKAKRILEIGSKNVNGSIRPLIQNFSTPKEYIGVDVSSGNMVDLVLPVEKIAIHFGVESFDLLISTELLEHVEDWRVAIQAMKATVKRGGYIAITTRSKGFGYHGYPFDFWRYEIEDIKKIFSDFEIIVLKKDYEAPGVFLIAKKPENYVSADLSDIALYSIVLGKNIKNSVNIEKMPFKRKFVIKIFEIGYIIKSKTVAAAKI
ncbi:MAG: class I SAM-dependent methyltransferase [Nitrososphaerota archaeon]|jgi:SAM-dependent methyltransferase|nr:class I SAM-dependent methyltransferase [Nitrososphaerota archaeon]